MNSAPRNDDAPPIPLPRRAVLVSDSPERAAALAAGFDDVQISPPTAIEAALAEFGTVDCVGISGIGIDNGALRDVIAKILRAGAADLRVFVDVTDPSGLQLLHVDASALAGLAVIGATSIGGVAGLVFTRGDGDAVPDLSPYRDGPAGMWSVRERAFSEAERLAADLNDKTLRRRITELEAELKTSTQRLATARTALTKADQKPKPDAPVRKRLSGRSAKLRVAAVGLVVIVAIAVGLALLTSTGYTGGLLTAACLLGAAVALYLVRAHRRLARAVAATRTEVRRGFAAEQARNAELAKRLAGIDQVLRGGPPNVAAIERHVELVGASAVDIARTLGNLANGLQLPEIDARQKKAYADSVHQTQAVANLFSLLPVKGVVPLMGGWAASADVVVFLVEELLAHKPRLIVECGSGVSTLWLALAIDRFGLDSRIVCLEHDARFGAATRDVLERHGVAHLVDVRDAPLGPTGLDGHDTRWYDVAALADLDGIGLLFVDGPPEATGPLVRYPAIPLLREQFAPEITIVLDDLIRPMEQQITKLWQAELPDFQLRRLPLEKGAAVFRRG